MKKVDYLVVGDTHGNWPCLLSTLYHFKPKCCIIAGDFGWWPTYWGQYTPGRKEWVQTLDFLLDSLPKSTEIRFIDGNHEDLPSLFSEVQKLQEAQGKSRFDPVELRPNLWYQPRGSTWTLPDGRAIFFCGGAKSVDWKMRKKGVSWFPEEEIRESDLPDPLPSADIVISHTVPNCLGVLDTLKPVQDVCSMWDPTPDASCIYLDYVYDSIRPKLWLASHLHCYRSGTFGGTQYVVLDRTDTEMQIWDTFTYSL